MIQPTYISERKCGNKWYPMDDQPVPLLRTNYLSEFRTEIEKAQARKNLGIPDEMQMKWGGMGGHIEEQDDLVYYVKLKAEEYAELFARYSNNISTDIATVSQALDYIMQFILDQRQYNIDNDATIANIFKLIESTQAALQKNIDTNSEDIDTLEKAIGDINKSIEKLNNDLINIDIAPKITDWLKNNLSDTIQLEDDKLAVVISESEGNALQNKNGLFVKDNTQDIADNLKAIEELQDTQKDISKTVEEQQKIVDNVKATVDGLSVQAAGYNTMLADEISAPATVGGITAGTTVGDLKGKLLVDIIDIMLFPTTVRDLIYPTLSYRPSYQLIEVGTTFSRPILTFIQNDAGSETNRTETVTLNGVTIEASNYDELGTYNYTAIVDYEAGEYLRDSKGQLTDQRVEAGSLTATATYITTYPWYAGNTNKTIKQSLVQFDSYSGEKTVTLTGKAVIELPGANSTITSMEINGGMGFMPVEWNAWEISTKTNPDYPNIIYKVWTLKDTYNTDIPHKLNFKLVV